MIITQIMKKFHKNMKKLVNDKTCIQIVQKCTWIVHALCDTILLGDKNERKIISFYAR